MTFAPAFNAPARSSGSASAHRGSLGAGPHWIRFPFTSRRYRLSAAIHPVARTGLARSVSSRRKRTNVLARHRPLGYQIHRAGDRSGRRCAADGAVVGLAGGAVDVAACPLAAESWARPIIAPPARADVL